MSTMTKAVLLVASSIPASPRGGREHQMLGHAVAFGIVWLVAVCSSGWPREIKTERARRAPTVRDYSVCRMHGPPVGLAETRALN